MIMINGRPTELPNGDEDFFEYARQCSSDEVVAILACVAHMSWAYGCTDKEVEIIVGDVELQIMALRDKLMVN